MKVSKGETKHGKKSSKAIRSQRNATCHDPRGQRESNYLKLATKREKLERERLEEENKLLRAKTEALQQNGRTEEAINNAINAFKRYSGHGDEVEDDGDQYDDY